MGWQRMVVAATLLGMVVVGLLFTLVACLLFLQITAVRERAELLHLPRWEVARPPEPAATCALTLRLDTAETVCISGVQLRWDDVDTQLVREARLLEALGQRPADATVSIFAERSVPAGRVQDLIRRCQANRFEQFVLKPAKGN